MEFQRSKDKNNGIKNPKKWKEILENKKEKSRNFTNKERERFGKAKEKLSLEEGKREREGRESLPNKAGSHRGGTKEKASSSDKNKETERCERAKDKVGREGEKSFQNKNIPLRRSNSEYWLFLPNREKEFKIQISKLIFFSTIFLRCHWQPEKWKFFR